MTLFDSGQEDSEASFTSPSLIVLLVLGGGQVGRQKEKKKDLAELLSLLSGIVFSVINSICTIFVRVSVNGEPLVQLVSRFSILYQRSFCFYFS